LTGFDIHIGYAQIRNPIALAAMAGIADPDFVRKVAMSAGLVVLGGYNLDDATNDAAVRIKERGRAEFVTREPIDHLRSELEQLNEMGDPPAIALNVRSTEIKPLLEAALLTKEYGAILEIDAHCRQPEMTRIGVGETLLRDLDRLTSMIFRVKKTGVALCVKTRSGVVDDVELAIAIEQAGADAIHIDAMKPGAGADHRAIKVTRNATDLLIIGNNSVVDFRSAKAMFGHGADMVSLARATLGNSDVIDTLVSQITLFQEQTGWYNAPKHICGGGDDRALAFCCLPVKPCAIHGVLNRYGITPQEFADLKVELTRGTPLELGDHTCFGTLIWCCKLTKPCFLRNAVLDQIGLSGVEYMELKKRLSEAILERIRGDVDH
jgi:TIM-barrel protein